MDNGAGMCGYFHRVPSTTGVSDRDCRLRAVPPDRRREYNVPRISPCVDIEQDVYRHSTMKRGEDSMLTPLVPFPVSMLTEVYIDTGPSSRGEDSMLTPGDDLIDSHHVCVRIHKCLTRFKWNTHISFYLSIAPMMKARVRPLLDPECKV